MSSALAPLGSNVSTYSFKKVSFTIFKFLKAHIIFSKLNSILNVVNHFFYKIFAIIHNDESLKYYSN